MFNTPLMKFAQILPLAAFILTGRLGAQVIINEIHFDPAVKTELAEFVELHNTGAGNADLSGWRLADAVDFNFPPGTILPGGSYLVVAENPAAFAGKFPGRSALGPWAGLLANSGETVELRNAANTVVDEVTYQPGFPWPTVGDSPGYSIELINPALDNDLGGNWRPSVKGSVPSASATLIPSGAAWRYRKGTAEASNPASAWRDPAFDDSDWEQGALTIGYESGIPIATRLADMRGGYTSLFLRRKFTVANPAEIAELRLEAFYDDGFKAWINGRLVVSANLPAREVAYNETTPGAVNESGAYESFAVGSPAGFLRSGENTLAIQLHNVSLANSTDCYLDARLLSQTGSAGAGPTPGARNAAFGTNAPPAVRQVEHRPEQPRTGEEVTITAKATDPDGVAALRLAYQLVEPGNYLELNDAAYGSSWTELPMRDDGTGGDLRAGDEIFTAVLPGPLQQHRRLVRYRIFAADTRGASLRAPYPEDPQPNFAYFVYDGVPGWSGAARPGVTAAGNFSAAEMGRLPAYHLIAKRSSVEDATWNSRYTGDLYRWWGTLVYGGKVYDHIRYRARGGVWRYAMGKNMWKFDFNRGHDFEARDNYGKKYGTRWRKLNLGANIQQGNTGFRGEQGMFESVGFRLFNLAGVESPKTHWATLRVVDDAAEAPASQFGGDFWGLYLGVEQEDGRFLDEHGLPDGNLYKMEGFNGELNNQGRHAATDKSDLEAFTGGFRNGTPTETWWRANFDLGRYYSYQAMAQAIHHYDICYGKNYFYFLDPVTEKWSVHTWDLDLTWDDNMYDPPCGAKDEFKDRVTARAPFSTEYRNRVRELRDLLFNPDQAWQVIDEYAGIVRGTNSGPGILSADRAMWDYHPVMTNAALVNPGKAGQGRFYQFPSYTGIDPALRHSFEGVVWVMKNYVVRRGAVLDNLAQDAGIPAQPSIAYSGPAGFPGNRLAFTSSEFSGPGGFAAVEWRLGEVRAAAPGVSGIYEIEPLWRSGELGGGAGTVTVPPGVTRVGHTYRARVRMKDAANRWSHWSAPVGFVAGEPENSAALLRWLRISEVMYHPPAGGDFEYVELHNASTELALDLGGVTFTDGIDFTFPEGAVLAPGGYALAIGGPAGPFRAEYRLGGSVPLFGPFSGSLNNDGETLTLKTARAGAAIASFAFADRGDWPEAADGGGYSIVPVAEPLSDGRNWRLSRKTGGSPGRADGGAPAIAISGARGSAGGIAFAFQAEAGTAYTVEYRDRLDAGGWLPLREIADAEGRVEVTDLPPGPARYYRVAAR